MTFKYKCPLCNAQNVISSETLNCRRCKSDFVHIYRAKRDRALSFLSMVLRKRELLKNRDCIDALPIS